MTFAAIVGCALALAASSARAACPVDIGPPAEGILIVVHGSGMPTTSFGAAELRALPGATLTQRQTVSAATGGVAERSVSYAGVLLRDLLTRAGFGAAGDRGARLAFVEAVANDGYRALFSWGELFNTSVGEQVLVVTAQDDRPLDAYAGPVALRSLADVRPGPRHLRSLCALTVRR